MYPKKGRLKCKISRRREFGAKKQRCGNFQKLAHYNARICSDLPEGTPQLIVEGLAVVEKETIINEEQLQWQLERDIEMQELAKYYGTRREDSYVTKSPPSSCQNLKSSLPNLWLFENDV